MSQPIVIDRPAIVPATNLVPEEVPGGATVMILNNDVTPFEVVVEALMSGAGLSKDEATKRMMKCHRAGWHPVASYGSADVAQTIADNITRHAAANGSYEHYRDLTGHKGPWPLDTEVMDAQQ